MSASIKLFLVFFIGYSLILVLGLIVDWHYVWSHTGFNFTSMTYPFGDIRNVTNYNSFIESGLDPRSDLFVNNEGQTIPPFNYPSFWLTFPILNIDNKDTIYFGVSFFILFAIGTYLTLKIRNRIDFLVYLPLLFSPVVALLIERGNNDQVAFFFVSLFCYFNKNRIIQMIAYYFAFAVKFFPVVIIASLTEKVNLKSIKIGLLIFLPVSLYILTTYPEIIDLGKATPVSSSYYGYGWKTYSLTLSNHFNQNLLNLFSFISIAFLFLYFIRINPKKTYTNFSNHELIMFTSGLLIYIATYIIGTSYDYRLVFLLLTIPTLLKLNNKVSILSIIIIVFLFWSHQFVLASLNQIIHHNSFKYLAVATLITKVIAHYALILLLIYNYRTIFEPVFFKWKLNNMA
ncbi:hypothetical protein [Vibrio ulleungensis]|uniref:DUF2029 domain-containing protein n=1 Tax=Vibrio ulleungensis TaxID=2807619 RepID=A0ABS2HPM2_9VIBR|nr:hypothetical protein [Vibrio ulleungensis]MBM7038057.1 hypothetical protein [Vibrio ulleungensis]